VSELRRGFSAAFRGLRLSFGNAEVRRSYAFIAAALFVVTLALDVSGIWALLAATAWEEGTSTWLVFVWVVARIAGILAILLVSPLLAIFTLNVVMPLLNEGPFLAGMRALDPARAQRLREGVHLPVPQQIKISLLRLLLFVVLGLVSFAVFFVPVVGQVAGPAMGLYFSSRTVAWELLDPYFALTNRGYEEQVAVIGRHHGAVVGFGLPFALIFAVPLLGPLVFVLAQASAATLVSEVLDADPASAPV
jgi:uncharacterized protein involved in cysteine biosynthesis